MGHTEHVGDAKNDPSLRESVQSYEKEFKYAHIAGNYFGVTKKTFVSAKKQSIMSVDLELFFSQLAKDFIITYICKQLPWNVCL